MTESVASFTIKYAFQVTGRGFFIIGEILSGTIKIGMKADFSGIGINKMLTIDTIEFELHKEGDKAWEEVGLGFSGFTETEKELLKTQSPFITPISIIK